VLSQERSHKLAAQLLASRLDVATLDICNYEAARKMRLSLPITPTPQMWVMFAGLMGDREAIARQDRDIRAMLGRGCGRLDGEEASAVWEALREASYPREAGAIVARVNVPPAATSELTALAEQSDKWWMVQRAGDGIAYLGPSEETPESQLEAQLSSLRKLANQAGGYLVLESGLLTLKRSFGVWGEVPNSDLMRRVKESYDPSGTLGCGRFVVVA
jgi:FAD/FMN-containing dehydrogenase